MLSDSLIISGSTENINIHLVPLKNPAHAILKKDNHINKLKQEIYYRLPGKALLSLIYDGKEIFQSEIDINQYGIIVHAVPEQIVVVE